MVKKNNKLTQSAIYLSKHDTLFTCPICSSPMKVDNLKSLKCSNSHTFDITKQGYLNLLLQQNKTHYDKTLFEARRNIIADSGFFDQLTTALTQIISEQIPSKEKLNIIDMGTGEGTHLANIVQTLKSTFEKKVTGIGIDISKEGILEAAKSYEEIIWIVADLAHTPLADKSCNLILNILSPSNYSQFNRVLKDDGIVIKVVPGENYLAELRSHFYQQSDKEDYSNAKVTEHFKEHFNIVEEKTIHYVKSLDSSGMKDLIKMTPLTWNVNESVVESFLETEISEITVDLEILIGKKKIN